MIARILLAVAATIAIPAAVMGASDPAPRKDAEAKTCDVNRPVGSRLGGVRRCRTKSEREAHKQEARETVDRIQSFKAVYCEPPRC